MVKTGARVHALRVLLLGLGHREAASKPSAPRLCSLPQTTSNAVRRLYQQLGGIQEQPKLAPGGWDLAFDDGLVLELDEEFHFNRYRGQTLDAPWAAALPWTDPYREHVVVGESRSGTGGKRWTNPSAENMFGRSDPDGVFGALGAARWKQRALYDAMKDASAAAGQVRLVRLSIYDLVDGRQINTVLHGRDSVRPEALAEFVAQRTTCSPCST